MIDGMIFLVIPLFLKSVLALPIYSGSPITLEHIYPALQHHTQTSAFLSQPLTMFYKYGNLEEIGPLSKGLITSHMSGQKIKAPQIPLIHPSTLAFASPQIHHTLPIFPIAGMKELELEKSIAGALIKQIPKVSKLPIAVSPKTSELSTIAQAGALGGSFLATPILASKALLGGLGVPYEF